MRRSGRLLPLRLGGHTQSGGVAAPSFAPPDLVTAPLLAWFSPRTVGTATLAEGDTTIDVLADPSPGVTRTWAAPTTPRRPLWVASGTGGEPAIRLTAARHSTLSRATGGVTGAASHAMFCVAEIGAFTIGGQIGSVLALGGQGATSQIAVWTTSIWGGGNGMGSPQLSAVNVPGYPTGEAIGPGFPVDPAALHLWCKTYDSVTGKIGIYCDGLPLYLVEAWVPNLTAGTGLGVYDGSLTADADVYEAVITSGVPTTYSVGSQKQRAPGTEWWFLDEFFKTAHPSLEREAMVGSVGDSILKASNLPVGSRAANNHLKRTQNYLLSTYGKTITWINHGNPGLTSTQIVALLGSQVESCMTPLNRKRIWDIYFGTNDLLNLASDANQAAIDAAVAIVLANYVATIERSVTYGACDAVMIWTLHKCSSYVGNSRETARLQLNTGILALASSYVLVAGMGETTWGQDPTDGGVYDLSEGTVTHFASGLGGGYDRMGILGAATIQGVL